MLHLTPREAPRDGVRIMAEGIRVTAKTAGTTSCGRNCSTWANHMALVGTATKEARMISTAGIWFGKVRPAGKARCSNARSPSRWK